MCVVVGEFEMKRLKILLPLFLLALVLVACGGQAAPAVVSEFAEPDINLEDLAKDLDVQTVYDLKDHRDVYLLDVREQYEYDEKHIPEINLLPMSEVQNRLDEIPADKEVILTCRSGNRSSQVAQFLQQNGYENVHNMSGGIIAWEEAGYPVDR
jgi:rhodanese-related sulfurtransferase